MNKEGMAELYDRIAKEKQEFDKQIQANPLSQYSTTQLKAELKRRKKER